MLTEFLMKVTVTAGSEWVMALLILLSVASLTVIVERALFYRKRRLRLDRLDRTLTPLIQKEDALGVQQALDQLDEPILWAAAAAHEPPRRDRLASEKVVAGVVAREQIRLERLLTFLGTLGNNAPFIGLFGTVLGIIRAFRDLSLDSTGNSAVVMAGISEALVATAVGLFVALPAVLSYNYFQKQVDRILSINESLAGGILAWLPETSRESTPGADESSETAAGED